MDTHEELVNLIANTLKAHAGNGVQVITERYAGKIIADAICSRRDAELDALRSRVVLLQGFGATLNELRIAASKAADNYHANGNSESADHEYGRRSGFRQALGEFNSLLSIIGETPAHHLVAPTASCVGQLRSALKHALTHLYDTTGSLIAEVGDNNEGELKATRVWTKTTWLELLGGEPFGLPAIEPPPTQP